MEFYNERNLNLYSWTNIEKDIRALSTMYYDELKAQEKHVCIACFDFDASDRFDFTEVSNKLKYYKYLLSMTQKDNPSDSFFETMQLRDVMPKEQLKDVQVDPDTSNWDDKDLTRNPLKMAARISEIEKMLESLTKTRWTYVQEVYGKMVTYLELIKR
jgi:hypothetical protein